jgi:hypothetical protein
MNKGPVVRPQIFFHLLEMISQLDNRRRPKHPVLVDDQLAMLK